MLASAALLAAIALATYFFLPRTKAINGGNGKRHLPSTLSLSLILSPIPFAALVYVERFASSAAVVLIVITLSLTLTLWMNFFTVPLAVRSKEKEKELRADPAREYPPVSIIVPAFNEEKVLSRTIDALLEVDYPRKEIIVVDDGSTDETLKMATSYGDRIRVIHKENGGKFSALNYGAKLANAEIIVVVDADTVLATVSIKELVTKFEDKDVVAVAGNVKVGNRVNWLTRCQALEYVSSIQILRRAFDSYGVVTVVPGALGAFKKKTLTEMGLYDRDTLTEDFDATIKVLKTGLVVQGSSAALAYTQAPETLSDLAKQRLRWYRGNFQTIRKHIDALTNPRFGFLHKLGFPFMIIGMIFVPFAGVVVWLTAILAILTGMFIVTSTILVAFIALQALLAYLAIRIDEEDAGLVWYAPFFVVGYRQIIDALAIRAFLDVSLRRRVSWTRAKRF